MLKQLAIMSAPERLFKCCVLGCTNEHRSLYRLPPSELRTLWLSLIDRGNVLEKNGKVPNSCRDQFQHFVCECQLQTKSHAFVLQIALPLSLSVFTDAVFMNDRE